MDRRAGRHGSVPIPTDERWQHRDRKASRLRPSPRAAVANSKGAGGGAPLTDDERESFFGLDVQTVGRTPSSLAFRARRSPRTPRRPGPGATTSRHRRATSLRSGCALTASAGRRRPVLDRGVVWVRQVCVPLPVSGRRSVANARATQRLRTLGSLIFPPPLGRPGCDRR